MMDNDHALPAFPVIPNVGSAIRPRGGMALRDYFAAQTLTGMVGRVDPGRLSHTAMRQIAADAYVLADAMMEARKPNDR